MGGRFLFLGAEDLIFCADTGLAELPPALKRSGGRLLVLSFLLLAGIEGRRSVSKLKLKGTKQIDELEHAPFILVVKRLKANL